MELGANFTTFVLLGGKEKGKRGENLSIKTEYFCKLKCYLKFIIFLIHKMKVRFPVLRRIAGTPTPSLCEVVVIVISEMDIHI